MADRPRLSGSSLMTRHRAREAALPAPVQRDDAITGLMRIGGVMLFPMLVWLGAHVAIPLPPFGVPFTLQTLAVVLAALMLGPGLGTVSMLIYLFVGMVGVPIYAEGEAGLAVLFGQTGGYLLGFVVCQPVIVAIVRRPDRSIRGWGAMILAVVAGHAVIFALGVPWLYAVWNLDGLLARAWALLTPWTVAAAESVAAGAGATPGGTPGGITWRQAVMGGLVPFLPGMVVKSAIAVFLGQLAAPWASRRIW